MSMMETLICLLSQFCAGGSGFLIVKINYVDLKFAKYTPLTGSSYIPTPEFLRSLKCLLNIENKLDNNCFILCYLAARYRKQITTKWKSHNKRALQQPRNYLPYLDRVKGTFETPMPISAILKFERLNHVCVNVFMLEGEKSLLPIRISAQEFSFILDLLLITDGGRHHYV